MAYLKFPIQTACFFLFFVFSAAAQETQKMPTAPILTYKDTLLLVVEDGKKFLQHPIKPKHTLYSIAKYYSLSLDELYDHNRRFQTDPTLYIGEKVKIPVPNKAIKRYKGKQFAKTKHVPIYYVVDEGDNLYQICKRYFDMPVDSIVKRNRLKNEQIKPGQLLHVAWMQVDGVRPEWRPAKPTTESGMLKERFLKEKKNAKETEGQGVCFWQKDSKEKNALYALHNTASIGKIIEVTNPMTRRTVYAKVIGRIPAGYETNIELVLSPDAARKIGARDPKFFVKFKYLK